MDFNQFFRGLHPAARFHFIAGTSGDKTLKDFGRARRSHPEEWVIALIDSEGEFHRTLDPDIFYMVQLMESWFLADRENLSRYYGKNFRDGALPAQPNVEEIKKADVLSSLKQASRDTSKRSYNKTVHAPDLLALIDCNKVQAATPNCRRLFQSIVARATL